MIADPQGAPLYLMKPNPPAGQENAKSDVFSPDKPGRVSWNELSTSEPAAARKFYGEQFGWKTEDCMDMGAMGEYRFIDHHGTRLGALCGTMPGGQSKWRYYIRVPSISAAKDIAEAGGGAIAMGPHQVPTGDWIIIGTDPQGAEFALVGDQ
jgi:predicted enzyme related to lactoylglutathione lyase